MEQNVRLARAVLLAAVAAAWHGARAAPILIQPIVVCDDAGASCAGGNPSAPGSTYSTLFDQTVLDKIYAQTAAADYTGTAFPGVTFDILPAHFLNNSSYLTTVIDQDTTTVNGVTSVVGNPIDQAHQLLRLPNVAASSTPTTLNVYLVNQLALTLNGQPVIGATVHGYGLIASNGAVIDTGAHVDTLAHELGHNLGLTHVDNIAPDANDLLQSTFRNVPASITDPAIATTIDLISGVQNNDQIARANQQLFTVNLASATAGADPVDPAQPYCKAGALNCPLFFGVGPVATNELLLGVKFRWLSGTALDQAVEDLPLHGVIHTPVSQLPENCGDAGSTINPLFSGGIELDLTFQPGCLIAGRVSSVFFSFPGNDTSGPLGYYQVPFSVEWDFSDGSTSSALFDATGNATSPVLIAVTGVDHTGVVQDEFVDAEPVPEPPAASVLLGAIVVTLIYRARLRSA